MWRSRAVRNSHGLGYGRRFPDFIPRETFNFDAHPHWFIGHMSKGRSTIKAKMQDVDILLEVRDARAPFSSAQFEVTKEALDRRVKRLVILNKADLITPNVGLAMRNLIEDAGQPCLLTTATENRNLVKIKRFAMDSVTAKHPRTLGLMLMVVGLPNVGKSTIINGLKDIAQATARHQGKESKLVYGVKRTEARVGKDPGSTRNVNFFQISNMPRLYCYDTPGISLMKKKNDPERNTKLALIKTMPDHFSGEVYLADYLLFRLNKEQRFDYVDELDMPGPTEDVRYLAGHIAAQIAHRKRLQLSYVDVSAGAKFFLDLWRTGRLGKLCLDHIPGREEVQRLRLLKAQTEPPGPWGPPCFPEVPEGLELERRPR
mmetsp:Transcript_25223/g.64098  ORF Transcript_25223/g.64098 Transcript_25223/m.64098 type:complete len:373 (-) Transcript_25223:51-1169(-)